MRVRPVPHQLTDRVHLSDFQVELIGPTIVLYGEADVSGHVFVDTGQHPIQLGLIETVQWIGSDDSRMETYKKSVSIPPPHGKQLAMQSGHGAVIPCLLSGDQRRDQADPRNGFCSV